MIKLVALACVLICVSGHGRLISPLTRVGHTGYENDPTGSSSNSGNNNDAWVCRHASGTNSGETWTAGQTYNIQWSFSAAHVGDCDIYISYDTTAARADMEWFKIANYYDCRLDTGVDMPLQLPSWLPSGAATLRFGWYALHTHPNVEFYSQCSDIMIQNTNGVTALPSDIITYTLIGANPVFPLRGDSTPLGYPWRFPPIEEWMVGPACACGYTGNSCALTEEGTTGHIAVGGDGKTACSGASTDPSDDTTTDDDDDTGDDDDGLLITTRCGSSWVEADVTCGQLCLVNADCSNNLECWADLDTAPCDISDETDAVLEGCSTGTWAVLAGSGVPGTWCQETCTSAATQAFCDPDVCVCVLNDGDDDDDDSTTILGMFVSFVLFVGFNY